MIVSPGLRRFIRTGVNQALASSGLYAPLTHSAILTRGTGSPTFTRATTKTVMGYAPTANSGDSQVLLLIAAGEIGFTGARRISQGVWSNTFADGSPIPASTLKGYSAEAAATNMIRYSGTPSNASWVKRGTATSVTGQIDPFGGNTGELVTVGAASVNDMYIGAPGFTASAALGVSLWLKQSTTSGTLLVVNAQGDPYGSWSINLALLPTIISRITKDHPSVTETIPYTSTPAGSAGLQFICTAGCSFVFGGAQQELGQVTSYIPTTTAAVTRNADVLTYQTASNFSDTAGTMYAEVYKDSWASANGVAIGSATNGMKFISTNSGVSAFDGTNTVSGAAGTPTGSVKMAAGWSGSTMSVTANNTTVGTGAYDGAWNLTTIGVGAAGNGNIKNVRIWSSRLSDSTFSVVTL